MKSSTIPRIRSLRLGEPIPDVAPRRYRNSDGYIRLRWKVGPQQYIEEYEHRIVAGRPHPRYHVHHVNGVKDDNRPENLEVLTPEVHGQHHASVNGPGKYAPYRSQHAMEKANRRLAREDKRRSEVAEMRRLYESGMSTIEVGATVGVDPSNVYRRLTAAGVRMRTAADYAAVVATKRLAEQYRSGRSIQSLAAEYRVTGARITQLLRDVGCSTRRPGRPREHGAMSENSGRLKVRARSRGICERCAKRRACEWHHRRNRSQGGDWSPANGVDLCTPCHAWITEHPAACYVIGWLVPNGASPEQWPVLRMGSWQQPGETWEPAEPHPRQIQLGEAS